MIINKLILHNFRIFRRTHEFDFSESKIIVVEGPNGHGKSTIFDAINWVLSGKIDRYTGSSEYNKFNYIINNNAFQNNDKVASVEITLQDDTNIIKVKRQINNKTTKIFIDDFEYRLNEGQNEIANLLINDIRKDLMQESLNKKTKIDMSTFLRSTTILSQEGLESFVRSEKPTERYIILEDVLGLTRYGEEFKDYLKLLLKNNQKQLNTLDLNRTKNEQDKKILETKHEQIKKHDNRLGKKNINNLLTEINEYFPTLKLYRDKKFESFIFKDEDLDKLRNIKNINKRKHTELIRIKEVLNTNDLIDINKENSNIEIEYYSLLKSQIRRKINRRKTNLNEIKFKKDKNQSAFIKIKTIQNIKDEITKKESYINEQKINYDNIKKNLIQKYGENEYKDLSEFKNTFEKWKQDLEQYEKRMTLINQESHLELLIEDKKNTSQTIMDLKNQYNINLEKIKSINDLLEEMDIYYTEDEDTHVNNIISEVQNFILSSKDINTCIVCGSYFNEKEDLKKSVQKQLENSQKNLNDYEKKYKSKQSHKANLERQQNTITTKLDNLNKKVEDIDEDIAKLKTNIARLTGRIQKSIIEMNDLHNMQQIEFLTKKIKFYDYKYTLVNELNSIQSNINNNISEIKNYNQEVDNTIGKNKILLRYIENPLLIDKKNFRYDQYIKAAEEDIKKLEDRIQNFTFIIKKLNNKIDILIECTKKIENTLDILSLEADGFILENTINQAILEINNSSNKVDFFIKEMVYFINSRELMSLEISIKDVVDALNEINYELEKHKSLEKHLLKLSENHRAVQSNLINKYLNELTLVINGYYQQISPHSFYDFINLIVDENNLYILLSEEHVKIKDDSLIDLSKSVNASLTLSAAQSTVLSMSIFLALNTSQNWSKLDILGIDDPFQNLDDINIFSFIDVLNNLIKNQDKQIIVSTHDSDFSKLIVSKLDLETSQLSLIKFESYTKEKIVIEGSNYRYIED